MYNTIINYTMERIVRLNSIIDKLSKRIESAPPGKLRVVQRPNRTEYYHRLFPSEKNEENKRFIVGDNLLTRSKSEYILATDFIEYKIPFLYERGLFLPVTEKWIYPDFTILNPETREEIYWEHFGMLDEPEYANKAILKLNEYELNGIHLGHQLIATFETSSQPLDISLVESIMSDIISGKWPR